MEEQNNPQQPAPSLPSSHNNSKMLILLGGFLLLTAGFVGGYLIGNSDNQYLPDNKKQAAQLSPTITQLTPIPTSSIDESWNTYDLPSIDMEFKLPPKLSTLGELKEIIASGETGTLLCGEFMQKTSLAPQDYIRIVCPSDNNLYLSMGTTSIDYSAGRGGVFTDLQGFINQNGTYKAIFVRQEVIDAFPQNLISKVENENGVEIITIDGQNAPEHEQQDVSLLDSLGDNTGALINTGNEVYPGLAIIFYKDGFTDEEIELILKSFKFTN